jgi:hypothetical protein
VTSRVAMLLVLVLASCERPQFNIGEGCLLNSDCQEPWVCGLDRCRRQCTDSRDCAAGLLCLAIGTEGGVCQLPEEASCALTSECTSGLVCRFGTCTTECVTDRDCPPSASCQTDPIDDGLACIEVITEACVYNSDCVTPEQPYLICGADRRCRYECVADEDCRDPLRACDPVDHRCYPLGHDAGL